VSYDSKADTLTHIHRVNSLLLLAVLNLQTRAVLHDESKLLEPEKALFDEFTPKLKASTYGSEEYKVFLKEMGVALQHHYQHNSHHPEHYENGINGMSLLDLIEMLCDWKAATERHADGSLAKSLTINAERFGISPQLAEILENTAREMGWIDG